MYRMVIVDISVPALDTVFDFSLSEDVPIGNLIEEIVEMICQHEKLAEAQDSDAYYLCCIASSQILNRWKTLQDYGIETGRRLMVL